MKRVQRKRTKGWKMPRNTKYVGRPTKWGNPFSIEKYKNSGCYGVVAPGKYLSNIIEEYSPLPFLDKIEAAQAACECYKMMIERDKFMMQELEELKDKDLACWCPLNSPCHADVLLDMLK